MKFFRNNGLSLALLGLFVFTVIVQAATGFRDHNDGRREHGQAAISATEYLRSGHFIEALAENWESEFLQMAMFVVLTAMLYQKGSPESKDPDEEEEVDEEPGERARDDDAPWPVRRGGWVLRLYSHSLSITFFALFAISFLLHGLGGMWIYNEEQAQHGQSAMSMLGYMGSSRFWFESMQNWQSEFLSLLGMVFLSVYLREKGSAESKPVAAPNNKGE